MTEQHRLWLGQRPRKCSNTNHSEFPCLRTRQGKELSHTLWHSLLLLHKALTQLSRSKIKLIWKLCRWEMYHVWHLLQPFWKQGGWSRKHHSLLPQTQFLHLASRPQWSSFSLNPSVSTSVNVFKISGAKQRSSLKKRGASSGYKKALSGDVTKVWAWGSEANCGPEESGRGPDPSLKQICGRGSPGPTNIPNSSAGLLLGIDDGYIW